MVCSHFGNCGACNNYKLEYNEQLNKKKELVSTLLKNFNKELKVFSTPTNAHRARAEFKIWHEDNKIYYALTNLEKNGVVKLKECPKVVESINSVMWDLIKKIEQKDILKNKLFAIEFLGSTSSKDLLVTLIYHKSLDDSWQKEAKELEKAFNISLIGRARKQKIALSKEYITQKFNIDNKEYIYRYYEGGFTQPNPFINQKMIEWVVSKVKNIGGDFLECYCGLGNFTIPLSQYFNRVLATEISKSSIKNAKINCELNSIDNIDFIRLNSKETAQALKKVREFNRLKGINLDSFNFTTALVDPPRAGLDTDTINLIKEFKNIIYISCNPKTLSRDLKELSKTHKIKDAAIFDQFAYTNHIESGVYLERV